MNTAITASLIQMININKDKKLPLSQVTQIMEQIEIVIFHKEMTASFIHELIEELFKLRLSRVDFRKLILMIMPNETVSTKTIRTVFAFILVKKKQFSKKKSLLQWVLTLLRLKFVFVDSVQHMQPYFVRFLDDKQLVEEAICLLFATSNVNNLRDSVVKDVLSRRSLKHCQGESMNALLTHFKLIRPSLLNDIEVNPYQNYSITDDPSESETEFLSKWNTLVLSNKSILFKPNATSVVLSIDQLQSFKRIETDAGRNLYFEQCIISNPMNFMFITVSSTKTQQHINEFLQNKLSESVDESGIERSQRRKFFEQIGLLQLIYAQELSCVRQWLKNFVLVWDGRYYQKEIFRLLENWVLDDFSEFYSHILWHLYVISKETDAGFSCILIRTLSKIVYNNHVYSNNQETIVYASQKKPCADSVRRLGKAVDHLSAIFMCLYPDNSVLLHTIIEHYSLMQMAGNIFKIFDAVLVPNGIVQKTFYKSNLCAINSLSSILNNASQGLNANNYSYCITIQEQIFDVCQILFADIMKSRIFSADYHELVEVSSPVLAKYAKYDTRISKNIALYGHTTAHDEKCTVDENMIDDTSRRILRNEASVMRDLRIHFNAFMELVANMKRYFNEFIHAES